MTVAASQCVVTLRPFSAGVRARTNAPVQNEATRCSVRLHVAARESIRQKRNNQSDDAGHDDRLSALQCRERPAHSSCGPRRSECADGRRTGASLLPSRFRRLNDGGWSCRDANVLMRTWEASTASRVWCRVLVSELTDRWLTTGLTNQASDPGISRAKAVACTSSDTAPSRSS
jgi:hypothetical protein